MIGGGQAHSAPKQGFCPLPAIPGAMCWLGSATEVAITALADPRTHRLRCRMGFSGWTGAGADVGIRHTGVIGSRGLHPMPGGTSPCPASLAAGRSTGHSAGRPETPAVSMAILGRTVRIVSATLGPIEASGRVIEPGKNPLTTPSRERRIPKRGKTASAQRLSTSGGNSDER